MREEPSGALNTPYDRLVVARRVQSAVNHVKARLSFIQARLEIHRVVVVDTEYRVPFNVKDAVGRAA